MVHGGVGLCDSLYCMSGLLEASGYQYKKIGLAVFSAALVSIPVWYFTSDPVWAVVILTAVDVMGFGPTIRKVYSLPYSESLVFFLIFAARDALVIAALENYTVTTMLFPASIVISCLAVSMIVMVRRKQLSN